MSLNDGQTAEVGILAVSLETELSTDDVSGTDYWTQTDDDLSAQAAQVPVRGTDCERN